MDDPAKMFGPLLSAEKFSTQKGRFCIRNLRGKNNLLVWTAGKNNRSPKCFYFYCEESSELKTGNPELTMEMFLHDWTKFLPIAMMAYRS